MGAQSSNDMTKSDWYQENNSGMAVGWRAQLAPRHAAYMYLTGHGIYGIYAKFMIYIILKTGTDISTSTESGEKYRMIICGICHI